MTASWTRHLPRPLPCAQIDPRTSVVTSFYEKPAEGVTSSRFASVVFYMFRRASLPLLGEYLQQHAAIEQRVFGSYLAWLVRAQRTPLYGMKLATAFQLIGQSGLQEYLECVESLQESAATPRAAIPVLALPTRPCCLHPRCTSSAPRLHLTRSSRARHHRP